MNKQRSILVALLMTAMTTFSCVAAGLVESYKYDFGASLGLSGYLGDANESNLFKHTGFAASLSGRYLFDSRWAVRTQLGMATLSGNTADFQNVLPMGQQYDFKSTVADLSVRGECNFFAFGIGETYKRLSRWSPFLSMGFGVSMSMTDGNTFAAFSVPIGLGVKYKLTQRLNLVGEFSMTKVFGDHVDSKELSDLYYIKSSTLKNTDWYSTFTVGVTYEFGPRCVVCNRLD